ncbi:MAG TPA: pyruvate dehydrogenase (acetyl-transferring), homodimeric type, partial [Casimicrobiaceae bacterium]
PIVAATDYVRAYPQLIASYVAAPFVALGTDGFGRSDTRTALRAYFEVDRRHVVVAALDALAKQGTIARRVVGEAIARYGIDVDERPPWSH